MEKCYALSPSCVAIDSSVERPCVEENVDLKIKESM